MGRKRKNAENHSPKYSIAIVERDNEIEVQLRKNGELLEDEQELLNEISSTANFLCSLPSEDVRSLAKNKAFKALLSEARIESVWEGVLYIGYCLPDATAALPDRPTAKQEQNLYDLRNSLAQVSYRLNILIKKSFPKIKGNLPKKFKSSESLFKEVARHEKNIPFKHLAASMVIEYKRKDLSEHYTSISGQREIRWESYRNPKPTPLNTLLLHVQREIYDLTHTDYELKLLWADYSSAIALRNLYLSKILNRRTSKGYDVPDTTILEGEIHRHKNGKLQK